MFFGPQGQRREEVRQISVGDGRLSKGELVYTFGAAQKDTNVLGVRGPNFSPSLDFGAWRSSALVEYGISRDVTASLGGAWYESRFGAALDGHRRPAHRPFGGTALKLDLGYQSSGGKAVQVGLGGKLLGSGLYADAWRISGRIHRRSALVYRRPAAPRDRAELQYHDQSGQ